MARSAAVFVDRDDTLMVDVEYCADPALVQLIPGAAEGLRALRKAGYSVVVVTNQSGIGRGYFDIETLDRVNNRLRDELRREGADYDALYYCPHTPEEDCLCRKPKPGLLTHHQGSSGSGLLADSVVANLVDAAKLILSRSKSRDGRAG